MIAPPQLLKDMEIEALIAGLSPFARGGGRDVFEFPSDRSLVLKKNRNLFPSANMQEWYVWQAVYDTDLENLFGRCERISETGRFLTMERLDDVSWNDAMAAIGSSLPEWLTDKKPNAFGRALDGRIKVRDYGMINLHVALGLTKRDELPLPLNFDSSVPND